MCTTASSHKALIIGCLGLIAAAQTARNIVNPDWSRPFPAFRIAGNLYYVGTYDLASYLIVTPQGNILINTGLADSAPLIRAGIEKLGFKLSDTKILTCTHAHWDHVAALAEMKRLTHAQVWTAEPEAPLLASGGKTDFRFGSDPSAHFEPVKADHTVKDGGQIALGGTVLTVHLTPGHTRGAASFTFDVEDNGHIWHVLIANMPSINPGVILRDNRKYPGIVGDYARTFRDLKAMTADLWLSSHAGQFGLHQKYHPGDAYDPKRFIDPAGFRAELDRLEKAYDRQLAIKMKN